MVYCRGPQHVIIDGPEGRRQSTRDSGQGEQEVDTGYLRAGHVAGRAVLSAVIPAPGRPPPGDPASLEVLDGSAGAPDAGIEVVLLAAEGQKVRVPQPLVVRRSAPLVADGGGIIPEPGLLPPGVNPEAGPCVASLHFDSPLRRSHVRILNGRPRLTGGVSTSVSPSGSSPGLRMAVSPLESIPAQIT